MKFTLIWLPDAVDHYEELLTAALKAKESRTKARKTKASRQEGLFKQVAKCLTLLANNPRHPSLQTHEFDTIDNPYEIGQPVFEAYAQNKSPGAYRIFWCYGPQKSEITVIAITPHP